MLSDEGRDIHRSIDKTISFIHKYSSVGFFEFCFSQSNVNILCLQGMHVITKTHAMYEMFELISNIRGGFFHSDYFVTFCVIVTIIIGIFWLFDNGDSIIDYNVIFGNDLNIVCITYVHC